MPSQYGKSSVFRALSTLKLQHYVWQDTKTLQYANSYKLFALGRRVSLGSGLPRQAWPHLHGLSRQVSGSVNLGFYDGRKMVLIETVESGAAVQATVRIGQELPLHCTAMGKSVLAFLSEGRLKEVLFRMTLEQITSNTHSDPKSLLGDLDMIRVRGYSVDDEEFIPGVFCVGQLFLIIMVYPLPPLVWIM